MEFRLLRSFQVLAEQGHFGRAARALHLSQPALTKQVRQLEEEVGAPLFDRGPHGAQLTHVGRLFAGETTPLLRQADRVLDRAQRAARGELGELRLGFGVTTRLLVPRLVSRFRKAHPEVHVSLQDMSSPVQVKALEIGSLDVGFVRLPVDAPLSLLPVVEDRLVLAVPGSRHDELVHRPPARLREEAFVEIATTPPGSPSYHAHVLRLCAAYGFRPRAVQVASDFFTMLALVSAGMGVAVVPRALAGSPVENVGYIPLEVPEARWLVGAAWRPEAANPARDAFLTVLREELARNSSAGARGGKSPKAG